MVSLLYQRTRNGLYHFVVKRLDFVGLEKFLHWRKVFLISSNFLGLELSSVAVNCEIKLVVTDIPFGLSI